MVDWEFLAHFLQPSSSYQRPNRFVYVKQNLVDTFNTGRSTKVLINPNFKPHVHVNPNFKMSPVKINHTVYVNPNILKNNGPRPAKPSQNKTSSIILKTRTKLVKKPENSNLSNDSVKKTCTPIKSKYKIVRSTNSAFNNESRSKLQVKKLYYIKNNFKIDKRPQVKRKYETLFRSIPKHTKLVNTTLKTRNVIIKSKCKTNQSHYVSINGILYKKSPNSLKKAVDHKKVGSGSIIRIRGLPYKLDSKKRTLKLLPTENLNSNMKQIHIGGVMFKRTGRNEFVKTNTNRSTLLSQAKYKSIRTLTNKMKKSNLPCPFYRKFGRCKGKEKGTCVRVHNPDQISLCPKFLQGACLNEKCLLSHKVSAKKMPTCKFYLEGLCSRDSCPYLHVKISIKADICEDFLQGFCGKAEKCDKRHEFLCPRFEKTGLCIQKKCPYPHGKVVRKKRSKKQVAAKSSDNEKVCTETATDSLTQKLDADDLLDNEMPVKNIRYYKDVESNANSNNESVGDKNDDSSNTLSNRPKLGTLPSFIPFLNQSFT